MPISCVADSVAVLCGKICRKMFLLELNAYILSDSYRKNSSFKHGVSFLVLSRKTESVTNLFFVCDSECLEVIFLVEKK
ncbi:hypothetical protein SAMN05216325_10171 [Nitrosomonas marina]|uniref:Uncharacterized protein n=1 Tax=Nitrosomonas marina TaxID=917 RepID=A0A1H8ABW4_9PROT|nr:hypothetical protein SAMN05216325_10171 [Nitrosomonas marina]